MLTYRDRVTSFVRQHRLLLVLAALVAVIWAWVLWPHGSALSVTYLDVQQGDCAFVRTPAGKTILIDAGGGESPNGFDAGSKVVMPFLRRRGVRQLDLLVMTHPHDDHIGGMPAVLKTIGARVVLDSGMPCSSHEYCSAMRLIRQRSIRYSLARRGQRITLPEGVTLDVLNPAGDSDPDPGDDSAVNEQSIVLRLQYGHASFLFTGDAGFQAEEDILRSDFRVRSTVLKVGHHGSAEATSSVWLRAVRPKVAVISVGRHNPFGHPARRSLQRLVDNGAIIYRTDRDGAVTITTDGDNMHVATTKR